MNKLWDAVWVNGSLLTCNQAFDLIENAAIAVKNKEIVWIDKVSSLTEKPEHLAEKVYDLQGKCLTPGFIDCHTHLIYGGNRAHEFEMRLQGFSYEEIAKNGGGIQSTVNATRAESEDALYSVSSKRIMNMQKNGVTTVEIKSGYGLNLETELKMLRVAKRLSENFSINISKTFLGAHTIPQEFKTKPDAYLHLVCEEMLPAIAKENLADAVDVFCEGIAFNLLQTEKVFQRAKDYGLKIKCHAEQLSDLGATKLAAQYQALSVDHLEHTSEESIEAIKQSGTVAVLLPGAFYFLREKKLPPIALLRQHQIAIAIASDCNPGTSPIQSLLTIMNMAATLFCLTPKEVLWGVTLNAAKALGKEKTHGSLEIGKAADFAIWDVKDPVELIYYIGANPLSELIYQGKVVKY